MAAAAPLKQPTSMFAMRAQPMCYTNVRDQQECMRSRYGANVLVLERTAELPNASLTCGSANTATSKEYGGLYPANTGLDWLYLPPARGTWKCVVRRKPTVGAHGVRPL